MVEGCSKAVFKAWLAAQDGAWRNGVEVVAMDPFHVVRLAGEALDACRRRVQQHTPGRRGRTDDPLPCTADPAHRGGPPHRQAGMAPPEPLRFRGPGPG